MALNPGGGGGGGGNGDPPPELPHHEWISCALDLTRLPPVGSNVHYFPQGHYEQWAEHLDAPPDGQPPFILCTVTSLEVVTAEHAPYALVSLIPADAAAAAPAVLPIPIPRAARFVYNIKNYNLTDHKASMVVPKPVEQQQLDMVDIKGRQWRFTHQKKRGGDGVVHRLQDPWRPFVDHKNARVNDKVFFLCADDGRMFIELRNAADTEQAATQRLAAPPPDLREEIAQSALLSDQGQVFTVTYYPHKGIGKFVVPSLEVEEAMEVVWEAGMEVRLRKDVLEHTSDAQYTIQAVTGTVTAVTESMWRGLEITWENSTKTMTSAWEVDIINRQPRKKRKVVDAAGPSKAVIFGTDLSAAPPVN
uniref:Uncharacterized protein n=1 Tax=Avena sativa TaxID=4498 RepID=A0ACD6ABI8_AVESA